MNYQRIYASLVFILIPICILINTLLHFHLALFAKKKSLVFFQVVLHIFQKCFFFVRIRCEPVKGLLISAVNWKTRIVGSSQKLNGFTLVYEHLQPIYQLHLHCKSIYHLKHLLLLQFYDIVDGIQKHTLQQWKKQYFDFLILVCVMDLILIAFGFTCKWLLSMDGKQRWLSILCTCCSQTTSAVGEIKGEKIQ